MRKIIRLLLALILGFIAYEVVDLWPVRPMWSKSKGRKIRTTILNT